MSCLCGGPEGTLQFAHGVAWAAVQVLVALCCGDMPTHTACRDWELGQAGTGMWHWHWGEDLALGQVLALGQGRGTGIGVGTWHWDRHLHWSQALVCV